MRVLSFVILACLSGRATADNNLLGSFVKFEADNNLLGPVRQLTPVPTKPAATAPSAGRHKCMLCEGNGCGCGCRGGGACTCHPGWRPSADGWWFERRGGVELTAWDSKTKTYWYKDSAGKWVEKKPEVKKEVRLDPQFFRSSGKC